MYNIHFESTQSRGQRIEEAMNNIAWDDMPAGFIILFKIGLIGSR